MCSKPVDTGCGRVYTGSGSGMVIAEIDAAVSAGKAEADAAFGAYRRNNKRCALGNRK